MKTKNHISIAASTAIIGSILLTGCSGGGDTQPTSQDSVDLSKITGTVTASKFKNAKVYVDLDGSGDYSSGDSEIACTNQDGEFTLNYPVDQNSTYIIMAENQDGSYCDEQTVRYLDDGTTQTNPDFMMYIPYESNSAKATVNPSNFINYLKDLREEGNITIADGQSDADLFATFIKDKKNDFKSILEKIKASTDMQTQSKKLESSKENLELDDNTSISFDKSGKSSVELADLGVYKEQSIPAKIGNLVISNPLNKIGKISEVETTFEDVNSSEIEEGATAVKIEDDGSTSNNIIMKKPIFSVISDNKDRIKLVLGNKSNIQDLGDITLSVTPYADILSIPAYSSLRDEHNATVILGADITVENSNGKRVSSELLADDSNTIAGVVIDKHSEIDPTGLKYYYFDGTSWIEDGNITDGGGLSLNDKFKLVPYVIAKPNDMKPLITITVDGIENIKDPVVVVKSKITSTTPTNSKILKKDLGESLVLDATANINGNQASFRIPNGFNIDEIVVLGEKLDKVTSDNKNSVSIQLQTDSTKTSLASKLPIITDTDVIAELSPKLLENLHVEKLYGISEMPYYGYQLAATSQSDQKQKAYYIIGTNISNFIGDPKTSESTFYTGDDINASNTLTWTEKFDDNSTKSERTVTIDASSNTLKREKKAYDQISGNLAYTQKQTYKFENNKITKTTNTIYSSNDIGDDYSSYNKSGSSFDATVTYNKVDTNTTNITFVTDSPYNKEYSNVSETESYSTTITNHVKLAGKAAVKFDSLFNKIEKLYNSDFSQQFNKVVKYSDSDTTYYASVNGKISTDDNNTIDFEGSYKLTTDSYDTIEGDAIVQDASFTVQNYNDEYYNYNTTSNETKSIFRSTQTIQDQDEETPAQEAPQKSQKVLDAVTDLENFDITTASLSDKLNEIKSTLGTTNKDEILLNSFIDLSLIYNDNLTASIIDSNSTAVSIIDKIMENIDDPTKVSLELANSPSISTAIEKLNSTSESLKMISDNLATAFTDTSYIMEYSNDENITHNDSLIIRSQALLNASLLKFISAYSYGSQDLYDIKTHTDGISTYRTIDIDEKAVINDSTFFKLNDLTKLTSSKSLLKEALEISLLIDTTKIEDPYEAQDISDTQTDTQKLLNAINSTSGIFNDGNTSVNINNLYSSDYYIDREDFGVPVEYSCTYDLNSSIYYGHPMCENYNFDVDIYSATTVGVDSSTIDEVILKTESNSTIYDTPAAIIEQYANE